MKGGKRPPGYTIIEVMIVLAISGVMFLIAASFISGKQERTAFTAGVNDMASNIQDTIEQVTDGQYSDIPLTCTPGTPVTFTAPVSGSPQGQGAQYGCVFLGKFLHFTGGSPTGSPNYEVFSLAGNRLNSAGNPAILLSDILPVPICNNCDGTGVDLTTQQVVPQSLNVTDVTVTYGAASTTTTYGFGFIQSPGAPNTDAGLNSLYAPGAQTVELVYEPDLAQGMTEGQADGIFKSKVVAPATSASVCVTDGTRYATIDVGTTNGAQLSANVTFEGRGATSC